MIHLHDLQEEMRGNNRVEPSLDGSDPLHTQAPMCTPVAPASLQSLSATSSCAATVVPGEGIWQQADMSHLTC